MAVRDITNFSSWNFPPSTICWSDRLIRQFLTFFFSGSYWNYWSITLCFLWWKTRLPIAQIVISVKVTGLLFLLRSLPYFESQTVSSFTSLWLTSSHCLVGRNEILLMTIMCLFAIKLLELKLQESAVKFAHYKLTWIT